MLNSKLHLISKKIKVMIHFDWK